ncbi:MAG: hypothetical protein JO199_02155, partial [Candidatus Eremiobacteraeota bacterium]|nr:hypothetical protein [Candidatus Eremiobacteraeota bacterium]
APRRTQSSVAISDDGERWLLLNCSPDVAVHIESYEPLQPRSLRGTPIESILLTDANVDHLGGLAVLRQSGEHRFVVRSSAAVREIAVAQPAFAPFARPPHAWVTGETLDVAGLHARAFDVPGTTPGYDGRRTVAGAVNAYEIRGSRGGTLLFAPVFSSIDDVLGTAIARAGVAFLDGSFYSDDELPSEGLMDKRARDLGHQPVRHTLSALSEINPKGRIIFTHLNNSNPLLDVSSSAWHVVRSAGFEIAEDGLTLHV